MLEVLLHMNLNSVLSPTGPSTTGSIFGYICDLLARVFIAMHQPGVLVIAGMAERSGHEREP